jgi:hypothetical protein
MLYVPALANVIRDFFATGAQLHRHATVVCRVLAVHQRGRVYPVRLRGAAVERTVVTSKSCSLVDGQAGSHHDIYRSQGQTEENPRQRRGPSKVTLSEDP